MYMGYGHMLRIDSPSPPSSIVRIWVTFFGHVYVGYGYMLRFFIFNFLLGEGF
jgi:hypothetical protein